MKRLKIIALIIACLWAFLLSAHSINAQSRTSQDANTDKVTGTVFSEEGEPLVGVFISIKDTKTAAQTDLDGKYSIKSPEAGSPLPNQQLRKDIIVFLKTASARGL